ncbi:FliH/SctL family protein [Paludibacterium yongneupense]|uniref:FliH/SctL family protein n=1 Tax=Paludibacterium yongneupense TaxID=400061 RepID=UPI000412A0BA|nr:FliH/SctL family protein [Paludibacterium yongneupense]
MSNKGIIPASEQDGWRVWQPGEIESGIPGLSAEQLAALSAAAGQSGSDDAAGEAADLPPQQLGYPTAAELEAIHQDAWQTGHDAGSEAGFAEGHAAGLLSGREQGRAEALEQFSVAWQPLAQLAQNFAAGLDAFEARLSGDLLALALELAERMVAAHIEYNPHAIEALLREALASVPSTLARGRLRVNPADLEVAQVFLEQERPQTQWQWVADESIARGGCLLDSPNLALDLTLATRSAALRSALGLDGGDAEL